jgi:hypothetical protein
LDPIGTVCLMTSSLALLLALQFSSKDGNFGDAKVVIFFIASGMFAVPFALHLHFGDKENSIIPSGLRNITVLLSAGMGFCTLAAEYGLLYYLPLYFQVCPLKPRLNCVGFDMQSANHLNRL